MRLEQFDGAKEIDGRGQAGDRRGQSRPGRLRQQNQALDSLRKGAQSMAEQMEQSGEIQARPGSRQ